MSVFVVLSTFLAYTGVQMSRRPPPKTNLPVERGAFVGRERALVAMGRVLGDPAVRVVGLVGPAGIGKTRLALRAAARELPRLGQEGGVWLVECLGVDDSAGLIRLIGLMLGLFPDASATEAEEQLRIAAALSERGPALVVVDGVDAVPNAIEALLSFAEACAGTTILATRRAPVAPSPGVQTFTVPALSTSRREGRGINAVADVSEAGQLFIERANEAKGSLARAPDREDLVAIDALGRHLEGVPQAIEVAAARCRVLTPAELLERLPRNIASLQPVGKRSALAGVVAWSLDLLHPWERATLAQCVIFHGGFTLEAARAVVDLDDVEGAPDVQTSIESLVEKALLKAMTTDDELPTRYHHPAAVRDLIVSVRPQRRATPMKKVTTLELLPGGASGEGAVAEVPRLELFSTREALSKRHASYFLNRCGGLKENVDGHGGLLARRELELEQENLLAVVRRALTDEAPNLASVTQALMALLALEPGMTMRGPHELFARLLNRTVDAAEPVGVSAPLLARALELRARVRRVRGLLVASKEDLNAALVQARKARDRPLEARALANLGTHAIAVGDLAAARSAYDDAIAIVREQGDLRMEGRCVGFYGLLEEEQGHLAAAAHHYASAIGIHQQTGDRRYDGVHQTQLARVRLLEGDVDNADELLRRALAIHRDFHNRRHEAIAVMLQGDVCAVQGFVDDANALWTRAGIIARDVADPTLLALLHARLAVGDELLGGDPRPHVVVVDTALARLDDPQILGAVETFRGKALPPDAGVQPRLAARVLAGLAAAPLD